MTRSIQRGHAILDGWRLAPVCQDPQKWCTRTTSLPSDVHPSDPTRPVTRCMLVGALSQLSACQLVTVTVCCQNGVSLASLRLIKRRQVGPCVTSLVFGGGISTPRPRSRSQRGRAARVSLRAQPRRNNQKFLSKNNQKSRIPLSIPLPNTTPKQSEFVSNTGMIPGNQPPCISIPSLSLTVIR